MVQWVENLFFQTVEKPTPEKYDKSQDVIFPSELQV